MSTKFWVKSDFPRDVGDIIELHSRSSIWEPHRVTRALQPEAPTPDGQPVFSFEATPLDARPVDVR